MRAPDVGQAAAGCTSKAAGRDPRDGARPVGCGVAAQSPAGCAWVHYRLEDFRPDRPPFISERQPRAEISTPYLRAALRMRRHAASRSASLTPSTWSKRGTALRTWRASLSGSLRCFGNANVCEDIRFFCWLLRFRLRCLVVAISRQRDVRDAYPRYSFDAIVLASLTASGFGLAEPNRPPQTAPPKAPLFMNPKSNIQTAGSTWGFAL